MAGEEHHETLFEGVPVIIDGLKKRADLNGHWGTCQGSVDEASGRIEVTASSGETIKVQPANLTKSDLPRACLVRIVGLVGRPELNGQYGILTNYDSESGRWLVEMLENAIVKLKPKCLVRTTQHSDPFHGYSSSVAVGDAVLIDGVVERPELSGHWATCLTTSDESMGEIEVALDSGDPIKVERKSLLKSEIYKGCPVRVFGLTGRKELNGLVGTLDEFDTDTGRWGVEMLDQNIFKLQPTCVVRVRTQMSAKSAAGTRRGMVNESEWLSFCQNALPGWRDLPHGVTLTSRKFDSGTHSMVRLVRVVGTGSATIKPQECVYGVNSVEDIEMSRANNAFVLEAGEVGVGPKIYSAVGKHRVMAFFSGSQVFKAEQSHFLTTYTLPFVMPTENAASCDVMAALGKSIGSLHAMPLTWFSKVFGETEVAKCYNRLWPTHVKEDKLGMIATRARKSQSLPRKGLFGITCSCHGDLHGGNILRNNQNEIRIIDWELLCVGHRGMDLAYFFLCAPGTNLSSRRAFAAAYLATQKTSTSVDEFLWDVERCMPIGLVNVIYLSTIFNPRITASLTDLANRVLDRLEGYSGLNETVVSTGIIQAVGKGYGYGFNPGNAYGFNPGHLGRQGF